MLRSRSLLAAPVLALLASCGGALNPSDDFNARDAGATSDTAPGADAAIAPDAGSADDAGALADVPVAVDAPDVPDVPVAVDVADVPDVVDAPDVRDVTDVGPPGCAVGTTRVCYSGPGGTSGVGACRAGTQTCSGGVWGSCIGEAVPAVEVCNGADDNCDGAIDVGDAVAASCAARPNSVARCGEGMCRYPCAAGYSDCNMVATDGCETAGACVSLTDGLVVHHPFDGTTVDVRHGANGTAVGVQFVGDRFGNASRAGRFAAASSGSSGSSVVIPTNSRLPTGASPRTLAFWTVDRRNTSTWQYRSIVGWGDINTGTRFGVSGFANLATRTDQPIFSGQSADVYASVTNIVDTRWHHLAVTYDGATLRIYVDGALSNSGALTLNTTTQVLYVGRAPVRMSEFYDGDLDDLRIYNRALGAAEIAALFHEGGWP